MLRIAPLSNILLAGSASLQAVLGSFASTSSRCSEPSTTRKPAPTCKGHTRRPTSQLKPLTSGLVRAIMGHTKGPTGAIALVNQSINQSITLCLDTPKPCFRDTAEFQQTATFAFGYSNRISCHVSPGCLALPGSCAGSSGRGCGCRCRRWSSGCGTARRSPHRPSTPS